MNYIEKIKNNVLTAIRIKKMALALKVDYLVAKVMYHNGRNDIDLETATFIAKGLKDSKIQLRLIDDLDLITAFQSNPENLYDQKIFREIARCANRKYINELSDYIGADFYYGKKINALMKVGLSLDSAIKIFELKIRYEMEKNGLSELAAISKLLFFKDNERALLFEKAYRHQRAVKSSPASTVKNEMFLQNVPFQKTAA